MAKVKKTDDTEVAKWITVKGKHIPLDKDGNVISKSKKSEGNKKKRPSNLRDIKKYMSELHGQAKPGDAIVMTDYFGSDQTYVKLSDKNEYGWLGTDDYGNPALMDGSWLSNNGRYALLDTNELSDVAKYSLDKKSQFADKGSGTNARLVKGVLNSDLIPLLKSNAQNYGSFNNLLKRKYGFNFDKKKKK